MPSPASSPNHPPRKTGLQRYRKLIHLLNQRYKQAWERAELLHAELNDIKASKAWRLLSWLRSLKRLLQRRKSPPRHSERDFRVLMNPSASSSGRVSIIIPFKDRLELLRGCLRSLRPSSYREFEVLLVDNGSVLPETRRWLKRVATKPRCRIMSCPGLFNFSRLCNRGAIEASGDYLLFLNNDTEVLSTDWLEELLITASHPRVGVVGATLLYPDATIQHAGIFPREDGSWIHVYRGCPEQFDGDHGELSQVRAVPAVTGACLLIRRELWQSLGGFDERFPVTYGDVDLCRRVRDRGLEVAITPHARLVHFESLSRGYAK
jgi:GT2 family glycosyltransferase